MVKLGDRSTFSNLAELKQRVMSLDTAEERNLIVDGKGQTKRFKALWNIDKNKLETIKSDDYVLIQHREVFEPYIDVLNRLGLNVEGQIYDYGGAVYLTTQFKNLDLIPDDSSGIMNGLRLVNSFDGYAAIRGEMWGMRLVCSNGMKVPGFEMAVRQLHLGNFKVENLMENFVSQAIDKSDSLKTLVSDSMQDTIEWKYAEKVYEKLVKTQRHREKIFDLFKSRFDPDRQVTRWDMYNIITEYATHGQGKLLSVAVEENLQKQASKLLENPITKFVQIN